MRYMPNRAISPKAIARARPTIGPVAKAMLPAASMSSPYRVTWPNAAPSEISSSGRTLKASPAAKIRRPAISIAATSAVTWPASFWSAIEVRECWVATRRSRLPLPASPASVPDSAMTDHSPSMTGRMLPTRQDRKPPRVSMAMGSPRRPRKTAGRLVIWVTSWARSSAVVNSRPYGAAVMSMNMPASTPTMSAARRLSRTVLP
jgi:hypothetical protein